MWTRHHRWTSWIAVVALLWSAIWPGASFAAAQDLVPFGIDICSAAARNDHDPAPLAPAHVHRHCAICTIGSVPHAITAPVAHAWAAPPLVQAHAIAIETPDAPRPRVTASPPRGPPLTV